MLATLITTFGLTAGTASAASFLTPTSDRLDGTVQVEPGVRSWYGTSDGCYRITLHSYSSTGWRPIRSAQGRTSYDQ